MIQGDPNAIPPPKLARPFDRDGSSFCVPMDSVCTTISGDLLGAHDPLAQLPISRDPSLWS